MQVDDDDKGDVDDDELEVVAEAKAETATAAKAEDKAPKSVRMVVTGVLDLQSPDDAGLT